ncbi:SDR family oxidoreductase [Marinilabilia salmonicolor]|uniref:SDR family oxidoreductase n=1 Tax=Marinilabilia salmonicolor TaxID=989 RepID=UPI000299D544|nr:SDR family oxidoreductase [Marinilabilia salmonicolor]
MKRIIVNGANGYVASNFINELLKHHFQVVALVRGNALSSAENRVIQALNVINDGNTPSLDNLMIVDYSLLDENFGLSETRLQELFNTDVDYFHFAASLKYDRKSKDELLAVNVRGAENSVNLFSTFASADSRFFFVGTAYSCGKTEEVFEEKFYPDQDISAFRNYYEWSKRLAENVVKRNIDHNGLRGHVIRLSQVTGDNRTGITKTDYGIFDFSKRVCKLAKRHPESKVRAKISPDGTQNLIPINVAVDYLHQTVNAQNVPKIMNFVANKPVKNSYIINSLKKLMPMDIVPDPGLQHSQMNALERLMAVGMSFTGNYTNIDIQFDTSKRDAVITPVDDSMDEQTVYRMLNYFIKNNFKKNPTKKEVPIENE